MDDLFSQPPTRRKKSFIGWGLVAIGGRGYRKGDFASRALSLKKSWKAGTRSNAGDGLVESARSFSRRVLEFDNFYDEREQSEHSVQLHVWQTAGSHFHG